MISDVELQKEKAYLMKVLDLLKTQINQNQEKIDEYADDIHEELRYAWNDDNTIDDEYWAINVHEIERKSISAISSSDRVKAYNRMLKSAYFARIDFLTEGETIPVYLGIASLNDKSTFYVYDWRAPIAGMFYDYEMGDAQYTTPNGDVVKGKIVLKRQYKIVGDKIEQIFDTDLQVIDSILKEMLDQNASDKMRNIVKTIQKEQNKIIRRKDCDILVVEGPAGSGKTSVAMHKIAYLLYSERNKINNSNILIISPNDIFSNYISGVLPEIGEDNVYQTTFMDFVRTQLDYKIKGSMNDLYEVVYSQNPHARKKSLEYNSIKLKYGATYINLIENYIAENRYNILGIDDVVIDGKVILDKNYLTKLANELEGEGVSVVGQGKKLIEKIILHSSIKIGKSSNILTKLKKALETNLGKIKVKTFFNDLYSNKARYVSMIEKIYETTQTPQSSRLKTDELEEVFDYTSSLVEKNILPFEDVVGYLYFKDRIQDSTNQSKIKYVLIDEAQDYTIMQYKILSHLFKQANITILGDINQSIMPFASHRNYESILNLLKQDRPNIKTDMNYLTKTYRSTYEINMFCKNIIGDENMYNQVDRHGDKVKLVKDSQFKKDSTMFDEARKLKKKYNTVAIITKTQSQAEQLKSVVDKLRCGEEFRVVTGKEKVFSQDKISIIPSYLAKGLEFDAVIIADASAKNYPVEFKNLLYVACTRALHKLIVYYDDTPSQLLKNAK